MSSLHKIYCLWSHAKIKTGRVCLSLRGRDTLYLSWWSFIHTISVLLFRELVLRGKTEDLSGFLTGVLLFRSNFGLTHYYSPGTVLYSLFWSTLLIWAFRTYIASCFLSQFVVFPGQKADFRNCVRYQGASFNGTVLNTADESSSRAELY